MAFQKGKSGNPKGRRVGSVSQKVALKNLLEEVFSENRDKAKRLLVGMMKEPRDFKRLCELKAQFEVKELPTKLSDADGNAIRTQALQIVFIDKKPETQGSPECRFVNSQPVLDQ